MLSRLKVKLKKIVAVLLCHRALYAFLSFCHANGCMMTDYPELYAPMAVAYAIMALRD